MNFDDDTDDDTENRAASHPSTERVVWIIGSGFSKPLGGPLFSELLDRSVARWVAAWVRVRKIPPDRTPGAGLDAFETGKKARLWDNAEECLGLLDEARTDEMASRAILDALGSVKVDDLWRDLSQFVAIATSFFVDRVSSSRELPEAWAPYEAWAKGLTTDDTIITFNYDRVVEELVTRTGVKPRLLKLHGSVPTPDVLCERIVQRRPVEGIYTPGPQKRQAAGSTLVPEWQAATSALASAKRLVVMGYSFPASDPVVRLVVLANAKPRSVLIALGPDPVGSEIESMFNRFNCHATNTKLLAQQFLAEGSARPRNGRFDHQLHKRLPAAK